MRFYKRLLG